MARSPNIFARPRRLDVGDSADYGAPRYQGYDDHYVAGVKRNVTDARFAGQMGYSNDFTYWVNAQPYVSRNVIPILLEAPLGFRSLPNSDIWIGMLRSLVEVMPMSIQGLNAELQVNTTTTPIGGAGQQFHSVTNVVEVPTNISFTYTELVGMPIYRFLHSWIRYLIMDPNTKYATINTIPSHELADLMADQYAMTMMFIEPDELHRFVNQSWIVTNMFPHGTGANTAKRDMANDMEKREIQIEFGGIAQYGAGVDDVAQHILKQINIHGSDPHARQGFVQEVSKNIKDKIGQSYQSSAHRLSEINRITNPKAVDN